MTITIRSARASDEPRWRELWNGYNQFYHHDLPDAITASTWSRILDPSSAIHGIVVEDADAGVVGIANYVLHPSTWAANSICYLEDLYVDPDWRAGGIGRTVIDWLIAEMGRRDWSELYWITKENNYRARALYDSYTPHGGYVRYLIANRR